jgi:hypothetical protein
MARLTTWKDIGSYLGRTARTAQRWERELGLPVHRGTGRGAGVIWALPEEIEAWFRRQESQGTVTAQSLDEFLKLIAEGMAPQALRQIIQTIETTTRCRAAILLTTETGGWHPIAPSLPSEYVDVLRQTPVTSQLGSAGLALLENRIVAVEDVYREARWEPLLHYAERFQIKSCLCVPIAAAQTAPLGALAAYYPDAHLPTREELQSLQVGSEMAELVVRCQKLGMNEPPRS